MSCEIETVQEPNGRWVATVPAVPGLSAFGNTQEESLNLAKEVATILLTVPARSGSVILGFYPGRIPHHAPAAPYYAGTESPALAA
jgi:predicted RNase H-like HicB family nuclease